MNAISYIKNVGKSFGYVAVDVIGDMNPVVKSMIETNKDVVKETYQSIKDLSKKDSRKSTVDRFMKNDYVQLAPEALNNAWADLKSGKWYNKERKDQVDNELMSSFLGDMNFDFDDSDDMDFGDLDSDFDDDIDWAQTKELEDTIDTVGGKVVDGISTATLRSAEYVAQANAHTAKMNMQYTSRLFDKVNAGIGGINATLATITPIIDPLNKHMQNSAVFYTKSTELQEKQVQLLETIVKQTAPIEKKRNSNNKSKRVEDVLDSEGMLDIKSYSDYVMGNIKEKMSMFTGMGDMFKDDDGNGQNMFRSFISSPLEYVMKGAINQIIPKDTKNLAKEFNKTLSGVFSTLLTDLSSNIDYSNPFSMMFSDIFGFSNSLKDKIDTGNYEKGKVDFDGITRQSIVFAIPGYLSKILGAISGKQETYDFDKGKWVTKGYIEKQKKDNRRMDASFLSFDLQEELQNYLRSQKPEEAENRKVQNDLKEALIDFTEKAINVEGSIKPNKFTESDIKKFGLDKGAGVDILDFLRWIGKSTEKGGGGKPSLLGIFNREKNNKRDQISGQYRDMEVSGISSEIALENGTFSNNVDSKILSARSPFNNVVDNYGNNIFFYLQGIYQNTAGGFGGGRRGGNGSRGKLPPIPNNKKEEPQKSTNNISSENLTETDFRMLIEKIERDPKYKKLLTDDEKEWANYILMSPEQQKRLLTKIYKIQDNIDKDREGKTFLDTVFESDKTPQGFKNIYTAVKDIINAPMNVVNTLLSRSTQGVYNVIYGDPDDITEENSGFLGVMLSQVKEVFTGFKDELNESILGPIEAQLHDLSPEDMINRVLSMFGFDSVIDKIKDKISNIKDKAIEKILGEKDKDGKRTGGLASDVTNGVTENIKGVGSFVKNSFKNVAKDFGIGKVDHGDGTETPSAAKGGRVTKTGMIAVSEGELIIPAEYNPFYRKHISKSQQYKNEQYAINKFYGRYADGGTVEEPDGSESIPKEMMKTLKKAYNSFIEHTFGSKEEWEQEHKEGIEFVKTSMKELGAPDNISSMLTGAGIGGGLSLLTGGVVSPLLGAGVGAAAGLIMKSKAVQDGLFGEEDEAGNRKGGLLPNQVADFITKQLPTIGQYGTVGAVAGTLLGAPGGPIGGAIIGSAIGFVKKNTKIREALFGTEDEDGILISNELNKMLKRSKGAIALGATAGLIAGPFGAVGNILVGSAIGFATSQSKFHEALFGNEDGEGGLMNFLKDQFNRVLKPLGQAMKNTAKSLTRTITRQIYKAFKETLGIPLYRALEDRLLKPLLNNKLVKGLTGVIKNAVVTPFKALAAGGDKLRAGQIRSGKADDMTAAERIDFRNAHNLGRNDKFATFDEMLANSNKEGLQDMLNVLKDSRKAEKDVQKDATKQLHSMSKKYLNVSVDGNKLNSKYVSKIQTYVRDQDYEGAKKYINTKVPEEYRKQCLEILENGFNEYNKTKSSVGEQAQAIKDEIKKATGLEVTDKNIDLIQDNLTKEIKSRKDEEKDPVTDFKVQVVTRMDKLIAFFTNKPLDEVAKENNGITEAANKGKAGDIASAAKAANEAKEKAKIEVQLTENGVIQTRLNEQGEKIIDTNDSETSATLKRNEEDRKDRKGLLGVVTGISTGVGGLIAKLFGNKDEKKEGIFNKLFSKAKEMFLGEDGLFGGIVKFFTGGSGGGIVGKVLSKFSLSSVAGTALGLGALYAMLSGKLNDLAEKLGLAGPGDTTTAKDKIGVEHELKTDDKGNPIIDDNGNFVDKKTGESFSPEKGSATVTGSTAQENLSTKTAKNIARGIATGRGSVLNLALALGKKNTGTLLGGVKNGTNKLSLGGLADSMSNMYSVNTELIDGVKQGVDKNGRTFFTKKGVKGRISKENVFKTVTTNKLVDNKVVTGAMNLVDKASNLILRVVSSKFPKFAKGMEKFLTGMKKNILNGLKRGGKKLAEVGAKLAKIAPMIGIATATKDFIDGYQDAQYIFQITTEPSMGQKVVAGAIRLLKNLIPFIGTFISDKWIVDQLVKYLGLGGDKLKEDREAAIEEAKSKGFDSVTDYLKTDKEHGGLGSFTTKEKISNTIKSVTTNAKQQYKEKGGGLNGAVAAAGEVGKASLKGLDSAFKFTELFNFMKTGDIKGLITYKPGDKDDNMMVKLAKLIPVNMIRPLFIAPTIMTALGHKVADFLKPIGEKIVAIKDAYVKEEEFGKKILTDKSAKISDIFKLGKEYDEMNGIAKALVVASRLSSMVPLTFKKLGHDISENIIDPIVTSVKGSITNLSNNNAMLLQYVKDGDPKKVWSTPMKEEDPENPIGGFTKFLFGIGRVAATLPAAFSWVGHKIADIVTTVVDNSKDSASKLSSGISGLISDIKKGTDPISVFTSDSGIQLSPLNPLGGILNGVYNVSKLIATPISLVSWAGHSIYNFVNGQVEKSPETHSAFSTAIENIKKCAKAGDVSGIWKEKFTPDENESLGGIWTAAFRITQVFQTVIGVVKMIVNPIVETVSGIVKNVKFLVKAGTLTILNKFRDWILGDDEKESKKKKKKKKSKGKGKGSGLLSGGSSFISQYDPQFANTRYSSSNVANEGCGPAVAAMAVNSANNGNVISMKDSLAYARRYGYENGNGTSADYFGDYFQSKGLSSRYSSNTQDISNQIASGNPVVLLGSDPSNNSKSKSPFGPGNHYVLAKGFDGRGNVIIDDPESNSGNKVYSKKILSKARLGISAVRNRKYSGKGSSIFKELSIRYFSGGSSYDDVEKIKRQDLGSWTEMTEEEMNDWIKSKNSNSPFNGQGKVFINAGKESGLDPRYILAHAALESGWGTSRICKEKNNYFGIAAFDSSPYASAYSFGSGLEQGIIGGAKWIADNYYNNSKYDQKCIYKMRWNNGAHQYATDPGWDSKIASTMKGAPVGSGAVHTGGMQSSGDYSSSGLSNDSGESADKTLLGQLNNAFGKTLSTAYGDVIGSLFGFSSDSDSSSSSSGSSDDIALAAANGSTTEKQKALVDMMKSKQGQLLYSQSGPRDPDQGSADCSSTVKWAYNKVFGVDIGGYTGAQLSSSTTSAVDATPGINPGSPVSNSSGPNESKLQPGDLLFYSHGTPTNDRQYGVSHVEMYAGDGQMIGHGGGANGDVKGPTIKNLTSDKGHYIMAKRLSSLTSAGGSGLISADGARRSVMNGYNSGNIIKSNNGSGTSISNTTLKRQARTAIKQLSGGASTDKTLIEMLKTVIQLLASMNNNTSTLNTIVELLKNYFNVKQVATVSSAAQSTTTATNNSELENATKELVNYLNQIASA